MSEKQHLFPQQPYNPPPPQYPNAPPPPPQYPNAPPPPPQYPNAPPPAYGGYQAAPPPPQPYNPPYVTTQPTPALHNGRTSASGDHFMVLSIVMTILCCVCGTWWALCCTIPAIIIAQHAQEAEKRGDMELAMRNHRNALILNIAAVVTYIVTWVTLIIIIIADVAAGPSG